MTAICFAQECEAVAYCRKLCRRHYERESYRRNHVASNLPAVVVHERTKRQIGNIQALRYQGLSYRQIALQLMMERDQVAAVCRMMGWIVVPTRWR